MDYNGRFITILTICAIIYAFYHYNKNSTNGDSMYDVNSIHAPARSNTVIDPERTDLSWYEKLIVKYVKHKKAKEEGLKKVQQDSDYNSDDISPLNNDKPTTIDVEEIEIDSHNDVSADSSDTKDTKVFEDHAANSNTDNSIDDTERTYEDLD